MQFNMNNTLFMKNKHFQNCIFIPLFILSQTAVLDPPTPCRDLMIVMDSSGSLQDQGRQGYRPVKDFVMGVIDKYYSGGRGQRLGVLQYSETAQELLAFMNHGDRSGYAINTVDAARHMNGLTNVEEAFKMATNMTDGAPAASYAILFLTDGESNRGRDGREVLEEQEQLMADNLNVLMSVFLTDTFENEQDDMRMVMPDERQLYVELFEDLPTEDNENWVINQVC